MSPDRYQARPLRSSDRPQPVDTWAERLDMALFVVGLFAILLILALVAPGGPS